MNREVRVAQWRRKMDDFHASGQTAKAWCFDNDIALPTFHYWRRKFAGEVVPSRPGKEEIRWLEVTSLPQLPCAPPSTLCVQVGSALIQVHAGFDANLLREVVRALRGEAC